MDIAAWLRGLGLEQHEPAFRANAVDGEVLPSLTAEDLKDLGVNLVGHRRKLLDAIARLQPKAEAVTQPPPATLPAAERRHVSVLFADLTGYTRLSAELDAEEVHGLLGAFFDAVDGIVAAHGGSVDKHIGDCVMAVFGAPLAHGNDAERAVHAALAITRAMPALSGRLGRRLDVHSGVASGEVVASGIGSRGHQAYTVTGDSVNLASRLADRAAPGEILISASLRHALAGRLDCASAGSLVVEGFGEPVEAWRVIDLKRGPPAGRHPFVGRRSELRQLTAAIEACRDTGRGRTVYIRGEAGIGKTRLVEEARVMAEAAGFACHAGLVLDFGTASGRDAVRSLARSLAGLRPAGDAGPPAGRLPEIAGGQAQPMEAAFLNDLLDLPQAEDLRPLYDAMDNATRLAGMRQALARMVADAARERALFLLVEDVHWADRTTLDTLASLSQAATDSPALLLLTTRPEGDPLAQGWHVGGPLLTIDLAPLHRDEALVLAGAFLDANNSYAARCIERAAGNPLFLEQLLRHAEERTGSSVPESVQSLVQARLDRLDEADKRALQAASVFGQRFSRAGLRHLLDGAETDCGGLVAHLLVRPQGEDFLFAHALIRDAVYATLLHSRRRELHQRAAAWFAGRDAALQAEHLDRADDPAAPAAYLAAARAQEAQYRYERAIALAARGRAIAARQQDRFALLCCHGDLLHDAGSMPQARAAYEAALQEASDGAERCRARIGLAAVKRIVDDLDGALGDLDAAEAAAGPELPLAAARIHFLRGNLLFPRGDIEGCLREHRRSLAMAERAGSAELTAAALGGLGDAEYMRGRMLSARERFRACVDLCVRHGFGRIEVANRPMAALTRWLSGDPQGAIADALLAVATATKAGHRRAEAVAHHAAYFCRHGEGAVEAARVHVDAALDLAHQLKSRRFEAEALAFRGELHRMSGDRKQALGDLREALDISRETGMAYLGPMILGLLAGAAEDPATRRAALAEGEAVLAAGAVSHNHLLFRLHAIEACIADRGWPEVERHAAALEDYIRPEPLPWSSFIIDRARALAAWARHGPTPQVAAELRRLRDTGPAVGLACILAPVERALAGG